MSKKMYVLLLFTSAIILLLTGCSKEINFTSDGRMYQFNSNDYLLGWGCLTMIVSTLAQALKRSGGAWFIFALLTGPFALFVLMLSGRNESVEEEQGGKI